MHRAVVAPADGGPPSSCDAPLTLDDLDMGTNAAQGPKLSPSGEHLVVIWAERAGSATYEGVAAAR